MVDNGSKEESLQEARERFPRARFIFLGRNTGFAYACNRGAELARGKVLLFLNQDAEIVEAGYRAAVKFLLADKSRAIASGRILYPTGLIQETLRRFPNYSSFLFGRRTLLTKLFPGNRWSRYYLYKDIDLNKTQQVEVCAGMFLMVRANVFRKLEGFDEGFFFYVEDTDFCKRAADAGWETWFVPETVALHQGGENVPATNRSYVKIHHYKGIYRYLVKHKRPGPILKALLWLGAGLSIVAHLAVRGIPRWL